MKKEKKKKSEYIDSLNNVNENFEINKNYHLYLNAYINIKNFLNKESKYNHHTLSLFLIFMYNEYKKYPNKRGEYHFKRRINDEISGFPYFKNDIKELLNEPYSFEFIYRELDSINDWLDFIYFPIMFDSLLIKLSSIKKSFNILPLEITNLISNLADLPDNAKIYNPFAGLGSFGVSFPYKTNYFGQEIVINNTNLAQLRLLAHNRNKAKIVQGDSIKNWNPKNEKYDLIVASPPFGLKGILNKKNEKISIEQFLIKNGLQSLSKDGKIIITVSNNFLYSYKVAEKTLRKYLVDNDLIETLIAMPSNLLKHTTIPFTIIVINKNKNNKRKNKITFINATSLILDSKNKHAKTLNYKRLIAIINSNNNITNNVVCEPIAEYDNKENLSKEIKNENIVASEYDLNTLKYLLNVKGVALKNILTQLPKVRIDKLVGNEKLINIKNLKKDTLDYKLDVTTLDTLVNKKTTNSFKLTEDCLLLSKVGKNIKPTFFIYTGNSEYYINHNIIAFRVNSKKVDIEYLISELNSELVTKQINALSKGTSIPYIYLKDLLNVKINLPENLEIQKEKVKNLKEIFITAKKREFELQKEILGLKDDSFREFASIKHTMNQYLNDLKSNAIGTRKFILKNNNLSLDTIYSKNLKITFKEHLLSIENTIDSMTNLLSSLDSKGSDKNSEILDLIVLIKDAQNRTKKPTLFTFEKLYIDIELLEESNGLQIYTIPPHIRFNKEDFYIIFSNIISNAIQHGFIDNKLYVIKTSIMPDYTNKYWVIDIENNGKPFPEKFTYKHLITRGEKTTDSIGTGIGGNDINKTLNKYHAKFELITNNNDEFKVTYRIFIPFIESDLTL